mgnify:CR=1 FL=1
MRHVNDWCFDVAKAGGVILDTEPEVFLERACVVFGPGVQFANETFTTNCFIVSPDKNAISSKAAVLNLNWQREISSSKTGPSVSTVKLKKDTITRLCCCSVTMRNIIMVLQTTARTALGALFHYHYMTEIVPFGLNGSTSVRGR